VTLVEYTHIRNENMKIISLNVNDFGGYDKHLEKYKIDYGYRAISMWDSIDKGRNVQGILDFIDENNPDIIVLQEFDINSNEAMEFTAKMKSKDYELQSEAPSKRPSMTVMFIKKDVCYKEIKTCHLERSLRAYAIEVRDYIIYGTHVPPKYDKVFWDEIEKLWFVYKEKNFVMIGDINTINFRNKERLNKLLLNAIDVWNAKGNEEKISVAGDYAIISTNIEIEKIGIDVDKSLCNYTDHPAVILSLD